MQVVRTTKIHAQMIRYFADKEIQSSTYHLCIGLRLEPIGYSKEPDGQDRLVNNRDHILF